MSNTRPAHIKKTETVNEIISKLQNAQGVAIAEYKNLNVAQLTKFRKEALKSGIEVKVYKDSLFRRAASQANFEGLNEFLTQQNIFIFSNEDAIAAPKLVSNFAKENKDMILKAGIYQQQVMDTKGINEIANLLSKEELYSMFASSLLYPLRQVMAGIKAVADKKVD